MTGLHYPLQANELDLTELLLPGPVSQSFFLKLSSSAACHPKDSPLRCILVKPH
jgi:hypothetical protein